ncbi:hemolysin XhlA family protein [Lysinibacillus piscis]|uniref:Hemolysin XhlA n=1 Tax=Lysinibacillus piscis TaxID=2518931 RepID=A0ABQ5NLU5_9BACI|nr:hemolysin XhlA family protein [Lysinibacillus sp. KH24]GLC89319.1 hypothetical protein LYSBPC_24460 [Lysinibacillus sp. KH24]
MGEELVRDVYEKLGEINGKLDGFAQTRDTADKAENTANEALASTKSAHLRIDKLDRIVFWAGTSIIGVVIVALMALIIKVS